ncbi:MAG: YkvA family protein [Candidatus Limnocylindrales bacterium]
MLEVALIALLVVVGVWLAFIALIWIHRPSRARVTEALRIGPDLVRLVRSLLGDPVTPRSVKVALGGLLVYLLSPIDLIPDFIPGVGSLDDIAIAAIVLRWAGRRVGTDGLEGHWQGSEQGFQMLTRLLGL